MQKSYILQPQLWHGGNVSLNMHSNYLLLRPSLLRVTMVRSYIRQARFTVNSWWTACTLRDSILNFFGINRAPRRLVNAVGCFTTSLNQKRDSGQNEQFGVFHESLVDPVSVSRVTKPKNICPVGVVKPGNRRFYKKMDIIIPSEYSIPCSFIEVLITDGQNH